MTLLAVYATGAAVMLATGGLINKSVRWDDVVASLLWPVMIPAAFAHRAWRSFR